MNIYTLQQLRELVENNQIEKITAIFFRSRGTESEEAKYLAAFLKQGKLSNLKYLDFRNDTHMGESGIRDLLKAFAESDLPVLTQIDLGGNNIGYPEAKDLPAALANRTFLTGYDIYNCNIGGVKYLAAALANLNALTKIGLRSNYIGGAGVKYLAAALANLTALTHLDLSDNNIGHPENKDLATALANLTALTRLDLSYNNIGDSWAKELANSLANLTALTKIDLSGNHIGDSGAKNLINALINLPALQEINLASNDIGYKGIEYLAAALEKGEMPFLQKIILWNNDRAGDGRAALEVINDIVNHNKKLISEIQRLTESKYGKEWRNFSEQEKQALAHVEYAQYLNQEGKFKAALGQYGAAMVNLESSPKVTFEELKNQIINAMILIVPQIGEDARELAPFVKKCFTEFNIHKFGKDVENNLQLLIEPVIIERVFDYESKITSKAVEALGIDEAKSDEMSYENFFPEFC